MTDKLDKFLDNMDIPLPDENARKTTLNMASAEFESYHQKKNQKKSQGFFNLSRLMGMNNSKDRRLQMKTRKLFYGGMATAMVVVLAGGAALYQTRTHELVAGASGQKNIIGYVDDQASSVGTTGLAVNEAATTTEIARDRKEAFTNYAEAVEEEIAQTNESFIPVPIGPATGSISPKDEGASTMQALTKNLADAEIQEDPSERWRLLQEQEAQQNSLGTHSAPPAPLSSSEQKRLKELQQAAPNPNAKPAERWDRLREQRALEQRQEKKAELARRAPATSSIPQALTSNVAPGFAGGVMAEADSIAPYPHPTPMPIIIDPMPPEKIDNDKFEDHEISAVKQVSQEPVSTFSIDVDTASYSFVRRQLNNGILPNPDSVRIEELVNYFPYDYEGPDRGETPFNANISVVDSPWTDGNKLMHIGIKGYDIDSDDQPDSNLVFLLDVSGSMNQPDKLPLLKNSFKLLLNELKPSDTVAIVVYAGSAGTVLEPTKVRNKNKILNALESLRAGGSTAGAAGIQGAYALAEQNFDEDAVNRVILATDGDFNVGMSSNEELKKLIEKKRDSGIFLSVLGFGQGNLNDHLMQTLAQNGNGIAAHIDSLSEAQKVLVDEATSSLFPIAKDVKIQVEFNPEVVSEYRLVGYETRALKREDFNNDKVDAGDIGAGHTVTAIYEIVPKGSGNELHGQSRYAKVEETEANTDFGNEYAFLKMRYKLPNEDKSTLVTTPISKKDQTSLKGDTAFAVAVAGFGQLLKDDKYTGSFTYDDALKLAQKGKGDDPFGYRAEFISLLRLAETLDQNQ